MATGNFKGIELVDGTAADFDLSKLNDNEKVYGVRTNADGSQGYLYINGKKYGPNDINAGEY